MSEKEDIRQFLNPIAEALGPGWSSRFTLVPPIGLGLEIKAEGIPGKLGITACLVSGGTIVMGLEGDGIPHFQVYTYDEKDRIAGILRACNLPHLLSVLEAWRASRSPEAPAFVTRPMSEEEMEHVKSVSRGLAQPLDYAVEFDPRNLGVELTEEGQRTLQATLGMLDWQRIGMNFPRQANGRIPLETDVLLAELATPESRGPDRTCWLCVSSPARRSDGSRLTLRISDFISQNASHRWDETPWLLGGPGNPAIRDEAVLVAWRTSGSGHAMDPGALAAESLRQLDAGRFVEAFALGGVTLHSDVMKILAEVPLDMYWGPAICVEWAACLRQQLWSIGPWILSDLLHSERQRHARWRAAKRSRPARKVEIRLCNLPKQRQIRKAGLTLEERPGGAELTITWSGTNVRAPECLWRRSVLLDIQRFGLTLPTVRITAVTVQLPSAIPGVSLADALAGRKIWDIGHAIKLARAMPAKDAVAQILPLTESGPIAARTNALHLYHTVARPEHAAAVVKYLHDPEQAIRLVALRVMRKLKHLESVPQVAWMVIDDPDRFVRMEAATTLKVLGGGPANSVRALLTFLKSTNPLLRRAGCAALLEETRGIGPVAEQLRSLLNDPDPAVAEAARTVAQEHEILGKNELT